MKCMVLQTYPLTALPRVVEVFLDSAANDPLPDYVVRESIYSHYGGRGIDAYIVYDIKADRAEDGMMDVTRRLLKFSSIEGLQQEFQVVLPIEQSLALLGKQLP